jgi:hypothetical protein
MTSNADSFADAPIAFLDEAGTSRDERYCTVGGFVTTSQAHRDSAHRHIERLLDQLVPAVDRDGYIFHATDIYSGRGVHQNWSLQTRKTLMTRLAMVPVELGLPVIIGHNDKENTQYVPEHPGDVSKDAYSYSHAFAQALPRLEFYARETTPPGVKVSIVAEENGKLRQMALYGLARLSDPEKVWTPSPGTTIVWPLERIAEPVFVAKAAEPLLQLADLIAFVTRRAYLEKPDAKPILRLFHRQIVLLPHQR